MTMIFSPDSVAISPFRDDLRRLANASPLRTYIAAMSSLVAYWSLSDTSGIVAGVVNPAVAEGRNLLLNPTPSSSTGWTLNAGWAYGSGLFTHTAGSANTVTQALAGPVVTGKIYKVVFTISGSTTGTVTSSLTAAGAAHTGNATFTDYILATGTTLTFTPSSAFDGSISGFSVTQVGIKASSAFPTLELVTNGGFDWDVAWTKGTNWTIAGGVAHAAAAVVGQNIVQNMSIIVGRQYDVTFTISNYVSGSVKWLCGGGGSGTTRNANGTYTETVTCATNSTFTLGPVTTFTGDIDNVSVVPHDGLVVWNGDGSTTTGWTAVNSALLSSVSGWFRVTRNGATNPFGQQLPLKLGSTYRVTGNYRGDTHATPTVNLGSGGANSVSGTSSNSPQPFEFVGVCAGNAGIALLASNATVDGQYVEFQNLVVTEIAPMSGTQQNGVAINQTSGYPLLDPVYLGDGVNDAVAQASGSFNSAINPAQWSMGIFAQMTAANWANASVYYLLNRAVDANNKTAIYKSAANTVTFLYLAGSTSRHVDYTWSGLGMHFYAMTIDVVNNVMIATIDGVEVGRVTSLGTWVGNLSSTLVAAGAINTSGSNSWPGYYGSVLDTNAALAPDVVLLLAELGGCA